MPSSITQRILKASGLESEFISQPDFVPYYLIKSGIYAGFGLTEAEPMPGVENTLFLAIVVPLVETGAELVASRSITLNEVVTKFLLQDMLAGGPASIDKDGVKVKFACVGYVISGWKLKVDIDFPKYGMRLGSKGFEDEQGHKYRGQLAGFFATVSGKDSRASQILVNLAAKILTAPGEYRYVEKGADIAGVLQELKTLMTQSVADYVAKDLQHPHKVFYSKEL